MYLLWENQQTSKACALGDDSRCWKSFFLNFAVVLFSQKSRGRVSWRRVKTAAFGGRQLYVLHILPIILGKFIKTFFFFLIFLSLSAPCLSCIHGIFPICCGLLLDPRSGIKPGPSDWEQRVLATGPGKSLLKLSESQLSHLQNGIGILWPWDKF